jgi:DNA polymerase-3 subunit epsilon
MTGGQSDLGLSFDAPAAADPGLDRGLPSERPPLVVLRPNEAESRAHEARLHAIHERAGHCLWYELEP